MNGIITLSKCDLSCWLAKERVCRCKCGGANHGRDHRAPGHQAALMEATL